MTKKNEDIGTYKDVQNKLISDNHEFIILPKAKDIGIVDANKSLENLSIIIDRAKKAFDNQFFLEFISLKLQYLEFYLKIYWVTKNPDSKVLDENTIKFFGTLIKECRSYGFDPVLINKIEDFNNIRVKAVHKFLMGATGEEELKNICTNYSKLGNELYNYILNECGEFIDDVTKLPQDVGTMIISRPKKDKSADLNL